MSTEARLRALCAAMVPLAAAASAVACPPPPPPLPTPQEQARTFWNRVDDICVVRLERATLRPSEWPDLLRNTSAAGRWQLPVAPLETWKGDCRPRTVHFVDIPTVLCGGGMPPFDTLLVAGLGAGSVMTVWTPAGGELATALRALAGAQRP